MSVQQDFIEAYAARWGCGESYAAGLLGHVLEEHAHELAEKIRNSEELRDFTDDHMSDCIAAADFIDSEVDD